MQSRFDNFGFTGANETIRLLALRVEFQPDTLSETTGDGKFVLAPSDEPLIDPPPHNKPYFNAQMQALANYYRKVSNDKITLEWEIFPVRENAAYTLPNDMKFYAPEDGDSLSDQRLSELFRDAIQSADQQDILPFSEFDGFIVFHAGVGRDIGFDFDPTPNDVPSAFLNLSDLREAVGNNDPAFQGVAVQNGAFFVPDGIILPETESQEGFEVGLLGTAAIMFGFQIGLPSLFDPDNGTSGVGRWGLMDQGSGNFQGLLPAAPSAWEKVFMGWETPVEIGPGDLYEIAASNAAGDAPRVYKIPINANEYFLIENRQRDVNGDGIAVGRNESGRKVEFKLVDGFEQIIADTTGVIVSVDEYDFGLPGSGILIWHIDETIIRKKISKNRINGDRDRRGVDLEEADGAQDIGQVYGFLSAGAGAENGVPEDAWWGGNPVITEFLRPNEPVTFSPNSIPSSDANSGAKTQIRLTGFSDLQPVMTFRFENAAIYSGFPQYVGKGAFPPVIEEINAESPGTEVIVAREDGLVLAWKADAQPLFPAGVFDPENVLGNESRTYSIARFFEVGSPIKTPPVFHDLDGDGAKEVILAASEKLIALKGSDENADDIPDILWQTVLPGGVNALSVQTSTNSIVVGLEDGELAFFANDGHKKFQRSLPAEISNIATAQNFLLAASGAQVALFIDDAASPQWTSNLASNIENIAIADLENDGALDFIAKDIGGNVEIFDEQGQAKYQFFLREQSSATGLAVADIDDDGYKDLVFNSVEGVWAFHFTGALLENFPVLFSSPDSIFTEAKFPEPVLADLGNDGQVEIFVPGESGDLFAIHPSGKRDMNFPLALGNINSSAFGIGDLDNDGVLEAAALSGEKFLYVFHIEQASSGSRAIWPFWGGTSARTRANLERETPQAPGNELLPVKEVYNYPNPTEGSTTTIRYRLNGAAEVMIKIIDLAGELVDEFSAPGTPNAVNEIQWPLDNIQEGVYIARVEARGEGAPEIAIFKIAVVK